MVKNSNFALTMKSFRQIQLFIFSFFLSLTSFAQKSELGIDYNRIGEDIPSVSLLTVGQGDTYYQLEGHSALRFQFPKSGNDIVINWGMFNFNEPNFAYRFIKGETDYSIGAETMSSFLRTYVHENRDVKEQELNLTDEEVVELLRLIDENLKPENRKYRYNYVKDNCATRPLAMIKKALEIDGKHLVINEPQENTTFRQELRKYHIDNQAYQLFIDYALGSGLDYEISPEERSFAPIYLYQLVSTSQISDSNGNTEPLVKKSETIFNRQGGTPSQSYLLTFSIILIIFISAFYISYRNQKNHNLSRWFDASFYSILGILGLLLTFLIFVSSHEATSPNVNYFWINPLCLIVPALIFIKKCNKILYYYFFLNVLLIVAYLISLPVTGQSANIALILLLLADFIRTENFILLYHRNGKN